MNRRDNPYNADDTCRFCSTEQREDCEKAHCKEWEDEFDKENIWQEGYEAAVEDMKAVENGIIINGKIFEFVFKEDAIDCECNDCRLYKICASLSFNNTICTTISEAIGISAEGRFFKEIK